MTIGNCEIEVIQVAHIRSNKDEGGVWHTGVATIVWSHGHDDTAVKVAVGCWANTNDDHAEWCAAHEGARAIEACVGINCESDYPCGRFTPLAFPAECEAIGAEICAALREAASQVA